MKEKKETKDMRIFSLPLLLLGLVLACGEKGNEPVYLLNRQVLINGSIYYNEAGCAHCHGIAFDGQGPGAKELKKERGLRVPDLRASIPIEKTPMDYFKSITMGTKNYKEEHSYQSYTDRGRWALSHYLYSLSKPLKKSAEKIKRRQALLIMEKELKKIYAKKRRWEMGYQALEERPQSFKLEELLPKK